MVAVAIVSVVFAVYFCASFLYVIDLRLTAKRRLKALESCYAQIKELKTLWDDDVSKLESQILVLQTEYSNQLNEVWDSTLTGLSLAIDTYAAVMGLEPGYVDPENTDVDDPSTDTTQTWPTRPDQTVEHPLKNWGFNTEDNPDDH